MQSGRWINDWLSGLAARWKVEFRSESFFVRRKVPRVRARLPGEGDIYIYTYVCTRPRGKRVELYARLLVREERGQGELLFDLFCEGNNRIFEL